MSKKIIIAGGGTGGHIFPALRMASYIQQNGQNIKFITNSGAIPLLQKIGYMHKNLFFYTEEVHECPDPFKVFSLSIVPFAKNRNSIFTFLRLA